MLVCAMESMSPGDLLRWYVEAGVDETIGEIPLDRYQLSAARTPPAAPRPPSAPPPVQRMAVPAAVAPRPADDIAGTAAHIAAACRSLAELRAAMEGFEGCPLKDGAHKTVFADGNPEARLMLVGEAPGGEEDRVGLPFVGASGRLLDRMLASIGLDRRQVYITNVVPWRPLGNRKPSPAEVAVCQPFIERHIELVDPALLMLLGGASASALLATNESVSRLRGRWHAYSSPGLPRPIDAIPTFHPAYLLRTPHAKRDAWRDLLAVHKRLSEMNPT